MVTNWRFCRMAQWSRRRGVARCCCFGLEDEPFDGHSNPARTASHFVRQEGGDISLRLGEGLEHCG